MATSMEEPFGIKKSNNFGVLVCIHAYICRLKYAILLQNVHLKRLEFELYLTFSGKYRDETKLVQEHNIKYVFQYVRLTFAFKLPFDLVQYTLQH